MKKNKIILFILIMSSIIVIPLTINAYQTYQINPSNYYSSGPDTSEVETMYKFGGSVAGAIQIVGTMVSAGSLIIIGIKYVVASAEEKANYKERMLPFIIGAVLLFGASNVVNILYGIFAK